MCGPAILLLQDREPFCGHPHGDRRGLGTSHPRQAAPQPGATFLKPLVPQTKAASDSSAFVHICIISNANTILQ